MFINDPVSTTIPSNFRLKVINGHQKESSGKPNSTDFCPIQFVLDFGFLMIDLAVAETIGDQDWISHLSCEICISVDKAARKAIENDCWDYSTFVQIYPEVSGIFYEVEYEFQYKQEKEELKQKYKNSIGNVVVFCPRGCNQTSVRASNPWDECAACGQLMVPSDHSSCIKQADVESRYADSIISNDPTQYDAIEVHGVRDLNVDGLSEETHFVIDDENPNQFSVYLHCVGGGVECVGDFSAHDKAIQYAHELSGLFSWKVCSFI